MKFLPSINFFFAVLFVIAYAPCALAVPREGASIDSDPYEQEFFLKCFGQIAGRRPSNDNTLLKKINSRKISGIEACRRFISSIQQPIMDKSVLDLLSRLHANWFPVNSYFRTDQEFPHDEIYNSQAVGQAYAHAFASDLPIANLFQGEFWIEPLRSAKQESNVFSALDLEGDVMSYDIRKWMNGKTLRNWRPYFAARGALQEIKLTQIPAIEIPVHPDSKRKSAVPMFSHLGGGILGNPDYLLLNIKYYDFDGGVKGFRRYGQNIVRDFLCREVPVLTAEDVRQHVDKEHFLSYKTKAECMRCHSTIDPLGKLIGHSQWSLSRDETEASMLQFRFLEKVKEPMTAEFLYRDSRGRLHQKRFQNLNELGKYFSDMEDFRLCLASRYYEFVTGRKVPIELKRKERETVAHQIIVQEVASRIHRHPTLKNALISTYEVVYRRGKSEP